MKKKFLITAGYPDSLINFRGPLIVAILNKGFDVHVAAPNLPLGSKTRKELEAWGVVVHDINMNRTGMNVLEDLKTFLGLIKLLRKIKPDFHLAYTIKPVIYASLAASVIGVPNRFALITGLGFAFQGEVGTRYLLKRFVYTLYRVALKKVDKVFFQNPDDEALFISTKILASARGKTQIINGSGVDLNFFSVTPPPRRISFLLIARLLGAKGIREYVGAAERLRRKYPDLVFSIAGFADVGPDAIAESELLVWRRRGIIQYLGKLDDVRPVLKMCAVYVLPSYREGTPRTVLEAMAMGRPVVTTDAPGCRETVIDGQNGFLVPTKAIDELAEAMERFVVEPALVEQMGRKSRQIAEQKYDVALVNADMLRGMGLHP